MVSARGTAEYSFSSTFNGFMNVNLHFRIVAEVNDARNVMTVKMFNSHSSWSRGGNIGAGFLNASCIMWKSAAITAYDNPTGQAGDRAWPSVLAQLRRLSGNRVPNDVIWGVWCSDNFNVTARSGYFGGAWSRRFTLSSGDFNSDGSIKDRGLVMFANRWYSTTEAGYVPHKAYLTSINVGDVNLSDLHWMYYPFAIRNSDNAWSSCNSSGHGAFVMKKRAWDQIKNDALSFGSHDAFIRSGNNWSIAPLL